jgi:hypothetical protein
MIWSLKWHEKSAFEKIVSCLAYSLNKGLSLKPQGLKDDFLNEHSFK